ncbi:hypothetical protein M3223_11795 [Paenibacillus pasadenensis]|uniref:hypothetical protein n=1 Tax=Paenibacillus pasadenensis TaxID=217090 RepID=UPI0020426085|nr:hypothetical protein [Paenibacillus pasadenensis]MCM3748035.1 hypothetical protein [Paenibacillus pasadenensis]
MDKKTEMMDEGPEQPASKPAFTKSQLMASGLYQQRRDLLSALLDNNRVYTKSEVDSLIQTYLNKEAV